MKLYCLVREPNDPKQAAIDGFKVFRSALSRARYMVDLALAAEKPAEGSGYGDRLLCMTDEDLLAEANKGNTGHPWYFMEIETTPPVQPVAEPESLKTYRVCVQQYVEQTAVLEIKAGSIAEARGKAFIMMQEGDISWTPGDDIYGLDVYYVEDISSDDGEIWER